MRNPSISRSRADFAFVGLSTPSPHFSICDFVSTSATVDAYDYRIYVLFIAGNVCGVLGFTSPVGYDSFASSCCSYRPQVQRMML